MFVDMADKAALLAQVGTANLDWSALGFSYVPTACHVMRVWENGEWGALQVVESPTVSLHILSGVLHYGQSLFEGLKAFHTKNGNVCLFRPHANAQRMAQGCWRLLMPEVPEDMFVDACKEAVRRNVQFVPPYGSGGSLYVRPFIFGSGARLGLGPAPSFTFIVAVNPVGSYYSTGLCSVPAKVVEGFDRAAPLGVGNVKVGGNYAADLLPATKLKDEGFPIALYLDAAHHKYLEEFSTSNFVAIKKEADRVVYITPRSASVLASTTNSVLMVLAAERLGMTVEHRPVHVDELPSFQEVAAVGTAVVLTPIKSITHGEAVVQYDPHAPTFQQLYNLARAIQLGEEDNAHGWLVDVADG